MILYVIERKQTAAPHRVYGRVQWLHRQEVGNEAGTTVPAVQLRVRNQGGSHSGAHKLLLDQGDKSTTSDSWSSK